MCKLESKSNKVSASHGRTDATYWRLHSFDLLLAEPLQVFIRTSGRPVVVYLLLFFLD